MPSSESSGLEFLLLSPCLMPGKKVFRENKTSVSVEPAQDETILFFCTDDQTKNPHCQNGRFRQFLWGNEEGHNLCDLIVFYARGIEERIICFTELKDNIKHMGEAVEQVISTYKNLKEYLRFNNKYTAKAFICTYFSGSVPQEHQKYQQELKKTFGSGNFECKCKGDEFTEFLRGKTKTNQGKPKNNRR